MDRRQSIIVWATLGICLLCTYLVAGQLNLFERLLVFSRFHDQWRVDALFSFMIAMSVLMPFSLGFSNLLLRRSLKRQQQAEARANHVSRHDALTGLGNRRVLKEVLRSRIATARASPGGLSVLMFDLDRFKPINDMRGHDAGDMVLRAVADRLSALCGTDHVPVRLGGDEFAVVIRERPAQDDATRFARALLAAIQAPMSFGDWSASISASIGIALWHEGLSASDLLRNADQAMYRSKREGRARFSHFDAALGQRLRDEAEFEAELTEAIRAEAIKPHFQPIFEMRDRRLVGFEVLARWLHPKFGQVPPARFIPVAEDTGQITAITALILRQACLVARDWDPRLTISVNLTQRQFADPDLIGTLDRVLRETGFAPARLELEVTEGAVVGDLDQARQTIDALRWYGIRISLDDFGTGFSSLATLSRLPFDRLKIDRSFITLVAADPQKARIVSSIILLAGSLDLSVVAEGIETEEEFDFLAGLDCDLGQGFLFEQALSPAQVADLLRGVAAAKDAGEDAAAVWPGDPGRVAGQGT